MKYILAFYALQFAFCIIIYGFYNLKKAEEANIEKIDEDDIIERIDEDNFMIKRRFK